MATSGCKQFDELCALVAAGAATSEEGKALENHLNQGCPACGLAGPDCQVKRPGSVEANPYSG